MFLETSQNSQENTCARVSFLIKLQAEACTFIKNETLAQMVSYEFCKISKNNFFTEHFWGAATKLNKRTLKYRRIIRKRNKVWLNVDIL